MTESKIKTVRLSSVDYIALLVGAELALCNFARLAMNFFDHWDTTIPETSVIYSILGVAGAGHELYRDFGQFPYTTTPYGPVYYLLCGALVKLFGGTIDTAYIVARTISLLALGLCISSVYLLARRSNGARTSAIVVALLACGCPLISPWAASARPDFVALAISLLSVLSLRIDESNRLQVKPLGLWLVAFFTKSSFVAVPCAWIIYLLLKKEWKAALLWSTMLAVLAAVGIVLAQKLSGGWFLVNTLLANVTPPSWHGAWHMIVNEAAPGGLLLLVLGIAGAVSCTDVWHSEYKNDDIRLLLFLSTACSLIISCLLSLKAGADVNYFFESLFLCAVCAAHCMEMFRQKAKDSQIKSGAVLLIIASLICMTFYAMSKDWETVFFQGQREMLTRRLKGIKGDILFLSNGEGMREGRGTTVYDGYNASYLEALGKIEMSPLAMRVKKHDFAAVLALSYRRYYGYSVIPMSLLEPLVRNYIHVADYGHYELLVPRAHPLPKHVDEFPLVTGNETTTFIARNYTRKEIDIIDDTSGSSVILATNGYIQRYMEVPHDGFYQIDLYAMSSEYFGKWAQVRVSIGNQFSKVFTADQLLMTRFSARAHLKKGYYPVRIAFINDTYKPPFDLDLVVNKLELTPISGSD